MESPVVQLQQWIRIGSSGTHGLVLGIHRDGSLAVGYFQNQLKAVKEDVIWDGSQWVFKFSGPCGSYLHGADAAKVKRGPVSGEAQ